jgi:hypothetical protein
MMAPVGILPPESDHQLARERDDHDAPDATLEVSDSPVIPERQLAFRLVPEPQPSHLYGVWTSSSPTAVPAIPA